jgi:hypothetical protein
MDEVFGESLEEPIEDPETAVLLENEHRRSSIVSYT